MLSGFFEFWTSFLYSNFLGARLIGVEVNNTHGLPVPSGAAPALWVGGFGRFVNIVPALQQAVLQTSMTLVWRYKSDGAVAVFLVVLMHEAAHPLARHQEALKRPHGVLRPVFQGLEQ